MSAKKSRIAVARTEEKGAEEKSTGEKDGLRDEMRDTSEKRKPVQAVSAAPSVPTVAEPASGDLQSEILRDRLEDALLEKKSNEPKK